MGFPNIWQSVTVEEGLRLWFQRRELTAYRAVPFLTIWGIWLARNSCLFEGQPLQTFQVASNICSIAQFFKTKGCTKKPRVVGDLVIDHSHPWAFFDGTCQGEDRTGGIGGVLYLKEKHCINFSANVGSGSNNHVELLALQGLMRVAYHRQISHIQIYGDSKFVID